MAFTHCCQWNTIQVIIGDIICFVFTLHLSTNFLWRFSEKEEYENFQETVREYNSRPPFNFGKAHLRSFKIHVSIYAAHLYDSVMLYANALHKMIEEARDNGTKVDGPLIGKMARNGKKITDNIIGFQAYRSISGSDIQIDVNGDSQVNNRI